MLKRAVTAIILVGYAFAMLYLGTAVHYGFLDALIMSFAFVGTYEMYHTFRKSEYKNSWGAPLLLCVAIYPLWYFLGYKGILIALSLSICLALAVFTFKAEMELKDLLATIFSLIYPMALVSLAFALSREFPCGGTFAISFAIFLPVFSDTFAYLVGSTLGKRKLCPSISPKKTVAGAIGGLLGSVLCAVTFFLLFDLYAVIPVGYVTFSDSVAVRAVVFVVLGIVGGVLAEIGDLAASRIKRSMNIKDFGNIFPGHGGVLDRLDSIMFTLVMLFTAFTFMYM
ncbi:MAG: phosphatidate cytidylyltransferase [Clostridiales bacterium]|nr:phosphatidate cytidylyltransferase [Clostridiales bacterium]MCI6946260.1 phosphatidate cytidylyltransferase [Clostridiales bacterium]MCI6954555.1 phosphatidate cytidylyltransferase [Clostridiales bacterium]MDD7054723.1 phosphatidate cytidylyltransferase [Clostridiales bacterium]MDY5190975.1 phosphatidate cytidylyltransferase [Eubacteriales bacterium]